MTCINGGLGEIFQVLGNNILSLYMYVNIPGWNIQIVYTLILYLTLNTEASC